MEIDKQIPLGIWIMIILLYMLPITTLYSYISDTFFAESETYEGALMIPSSVFYKANPIYTPDNPQSLGTISEFDVRVIECMVKKESGGNPEAYNPEDTDGYPAYGLLQFKTFTFKEFCVDRYGYPDDIWNPDIQYACAKKMIKDNYGYHWPSYLLCKTEK